MTYDPRMGSSPYLGADDQTTDSIDATGTGYSSEPMTTLLGRTGGQRAGQASVADSQQAPATVRRSNQAPNRGVAPQPAPLRRRGAAPAPAPARHAVPSPAQQPYGHQSRRRGGSQRIVDALAMLGLYLAALSARLLAILLALVMITSAFSATVGPLRQAIVVRFGLTALLAPSALLGQFVFETPFGGLLRGDLAIVSIILFCADWICMKLLASLRTRRERGA